MATVRMTLLVWTVVLATDRLLASGAVRLPGSAKGCSVASPSPGPCIVAESIPFLPDDFGDRYAIERELGHGATATVYLARDLKFDDKFVAIKVLSEHFALPVPRERFLREIQTTARLNHPHIVTLLDSGTTRAEPQRPFYVMRFIDGYTLRDVIGRGPLPVTEALRIARQAAGALGHAHRHGVIHRDVKPGNIMLEDGHTWVTDFGIARAMAARDSETVTSTGVTIGTPAYMSPEQAMGRGKLDARTDVYSLGCVLYEMLAGRMPFDGPDVQVILNKHLVEPLPPIRQFRSDVPERVAQLLDIALAKKPEERLATAAEFAEALSLEGAGALTPTRTQPVDGDPGNGFHWPSRKAVVRGAALGVGVAAIAAWVLTRPTLLPERYLISRAWVYQAGMDPAVNAGRLLHDALNEWGGIQVVGESEDGSSGRAGVTARRAKAGWYITGVVSRVGDSVRVRATLYGTRGDSLVRERSVNLAPDLAGSDAAFAGLADRLLFDDSVVAANGMRAGTRSVAARQAFARGLAAVQDWELAPAERAFNLATHDDPGYAQAHLWLAQVRSWRDTAVATWRSSAKLAVAAAAELSSHDRLVSEALWALAEGDTEHACGVWHQLSRRWQFDFAAWYGLANCLKGDKIVVPDPRSPSGWRFRSSYHHAIIAFQQAFQLLPSVHKALRTNAYATVRGLLITGGTSFLREGHALGHDTVRFVAPVLWQGDTVALIPYRPSDLSKSRRLTSRERTSAGVRRQRARFHEIATAWLTKYPTSSGALEAFATSLEMLGEPSALDTLRRARAAEPDSGERFRLAVAEVWLQLKFSIPSDQSGVGEAHRLADSLLSLRRRVTPGEARLLTSVAAVCGRARLAAALARQAATEWRAPGPIARTGPALLLYTSLGGPVDSLHVLEQQVQAAISNAVEMPQRRSARMQWLARPATLAFPDQILQAITTLADSGDDLLDVQKAYAGGDSAAVRRFKAARAIVRRRFAPADLTLDALYPEARLLAAIGDDRGAIAWLDSTLNALSGTAPQVFEDPARAASLTRAIALRADLAERVHDKTTATQWAHIVTILWSNADDFLQPAVERMQRLAQ